MQENSKLHKICPKRVHTAQTTKAYQSLITRGRGQSFVIGRLKVPLGVWRVTTRTLWSLPG